MRRVPFLAIAFLFALLAISPAKELPKIAIWDLSHRNIPQDYSQQLTDILATEVTKLGRFEVYSQENVRTLAGWEAQKMQLGCNDSKCLTALGQMDIAKLISGSVGKLGNRYSISLSLFDTAAVKSENRVSEFCNSENELIELIQAAVRKLLGEKTVSGAPSAQAKVVSPPPPTPPATKPSEPQRPPTPQVITTGTWKDFVTGMEFVFVKGGCFEMGDTFGDGRGDEKPVHEVCVGDFYMGKYEVTQGQWRGIMGSNPSGYKSCGNDCPVETVSWNDAQEFISRQNQRTGKRFRLPTEAEWEYAARSGGKREKWAGTNSEGDLGDYAWYEKNSGWQTLPVGQKKPNELGLYDMSGNVAEWCTDWYDKDYYQGSPKDDPDGPSSGDYRVLRGGSYKFNAWSGRAARRDSYDPKRGFSDNGFRLVLAPR